MGRRAASCAGLVALVGAAVALPAWGRGDAEPVHVLGKRPTGMRAVAGEFAVLGADRTAAGMDVRAHAVPGWSLVTARGVRAAEWERVLVAVGGEFVSPVFINERGGRAIVTPEVFVRLAPGGDAAGLEAAMAARGLAVLERDWRGMAGVYRARSAARDGLAVLAQARDLAGRGDVAFAEPDMVVTGRGALVPNDPLFPQQWGLLNTGQAGGVAGFDMRVPAAWDVTVGSEAVTVTILDTGVDQSHPDLNQRPGIDYTGTGLDGGPVNGCESHGTACAGIVSARLNNLLGGVGVAPGSRVLSARFAIGDAAACDGSWSTLFSWTASAVNGTLASGSRVLNNSNFFGFTSSLVEAAFDHVRAGGVVHVASAGNGGVPTLAYPASYPGVLAVTAVTPGGARAGFAQFGPGLSLSAPGVTVLTTDRVGPAGYTGGDTVAFTGTSAAAPMVAGVAALMLSHRPGLTHDQVVGVLAATARDLGPAGYDTGFGWGMPNAAEALRVAAAVTCYANCDGSTDAPVLNSLDFACFLSRFRAAASEGPGSVGAAYGNCDGSTTFPQLNALDFGCFLTRFQLGCE